MKKRIILFLTFSILILCAWYFFIKEYDYKITFKSTQAPGIIYNSLADLNDWKPQDSVTVTNLSKTPFTNLTQQFLIKNKAIKIDWLISRESDSITKVTALLKDTQNGFSEKLKVPFVKTDFVNLSIETLKKIKGGLKLQQDAYKLSTISSGIIPKQYCAYVTCTTKLYNKANEMIKNNFIVMEYLTENNVKLKGFPFLEVLNWNIDESELTFNFCFPIDEAENLLPSDEIKFKHTDEKQALKIVFNGNYRISDRAWFTIMDFAERNNIQLDLTPVEFFKNDPHSGSNELEWVAEIYMPIKE